MRWRRRVFVAAALVVAACTGAEPSATAPVGGVTLAYAGNLDGEIEPCG
ncbi:MAG: hypothetical protein Q8P18_01030 [Pseudomonadota bacterium]|nr:hypothetical protein [Pseudomonadota bacterium]